MPDINVNKLSEALNTKADIDLNNTGVFSTSGGLVNLTSSTPANAIGKEVTTADFIKSDIQSNLLNYTTNRILEIPQDIKLELNNGTLTLKAGSKVYVPNGFEADGTTPKFDEVVIANDVIQTNGFNTQHSMMYQLSLNNFSHFIQGYNLFSGATDPTGVPTTACNYNTALNKMRFTGDGGSSWSDVDYSLPFAISTSNSSQYTSIDQVFNGFGYIGSTIFALPGIKCQFADGRNEDGSYKSYVKTTDKILTKTFGAETFNGFDCSLVCRNDIIDGFAWHVNEDFDNKSGYIMINKTERIDKNLCPVFRFFINPSSGNGKISQFIPNPVDKLNWKSTELSGLSMPSSRYIDLTLGASGSTYTAPANGWFVLHKAANSVGQYVFMHTIGVDIGTCFNVSSGTDIPSYFLPVKAGDIVGIDYTLGGATKQFRFIYAEGEK